MGTLKLNKKVESKQIQHVKDVEKTPIMKAVQAVKEEVATVTKTEEFALCELAKQDDGFVEELKELRTENETVYRRSDRTCRKIITATPTRYRDANGELKEISNMLSDNGKEIVNKANSFKVKFNKDSHNENIFDLQRGKKTLSLSAVSSTKAHNHSCGCKCELCSGENNVVTATLDDGTEIQYVTLNDRIKENIIIKERQASYEYNFKLNIGDLTVEEGEHNDLLLKDATTGEVEYVIPAPYMYDSNKLRSDNVSYEIDVNDEELLIKVVADAEFINSNDSVMPLYIESQLVLTGQSNGIYFYTVQRIIDEDIVSQRLDGFLEIFDEVVNISTGHVEYTVPKSIENGIITKVTLALTCDEGTGFIDVGGQIIRPKHDEYIDVLFDVTNQTSGSIFISAVQNFSSAFFVTSGDYAPRFIVDYVYTPEPYGDTQYEDDYLPAIKEFDFTDKAKGYFYANSGAVATTFNSFDSSDFVLPINITHIHKLGVGETNYGLNWRLNLDKKLNVATDDTAKTTRYIYTDEFGDKYIFKETYYYFSGTDKVFVAKDVINVNANGELTYKGYTVYKHQSCNGYALISEINDFKNSELIEQRQNEQIQLEEFVKQYEPTLKSYVKVYADTGEIYRELGELTKPNYETLFSSVDSTYLIMTESEALQLQSLYKSVGKLQTKVNKMKNANKEAKDKNQAAPYTQDEIDEVDYELKFTTAQRDILKTQSKETLPIIKDIFIKYFSKKAQLELLLLQIPVNYVMDNNNIIHGFNNNGDLVIIGDRYGNVVYVDYNINRQIIGISDSNGKSMRFEYSGGKLSGISDNRGRTVKYNYDAQKLNSVIFADGSSLTFKYQSNAMRTIESSNELQVKLSYDDYKRITEITNASPRVTIGKEITKEKDSFTEVLSQWTIEYKSGTKICSKESQQETYKFDDNNRILYYEIVDNGNNITKTNYSYLKTDITQITATEQYNNEAATTNIKKYNGLDLLYSETEDWRKISDTVRVKTEKEYEYDVNNQLISEVVKIYTEVDRIIKQETQFTNYSYNANGSLVLIESYVEGEELTSGKNYEERVYDDNGNVVKTIKWNSLDSSSKFYSESNYAENGQVTAVLDGIDNTSAEFEYVSGTNVVNSIKYANGSKFACGRNPFNYEVNSITQNTEEGEANTTDIVYQLGLPVGVKSGNTVIEYTYNAERQKSQISVNGNVQLKSEYKGYNYNSKNNSVRYIEETDTYYIDASDTVKVNYAKNGVLDEASGKIKVNESLTVVNKKLYQKNYSVKGLLESVTYEDNGSKELKCEYNPYDLLTKAVTSQGGTVQLTESYQYDAENNVTQKSIVGAVNHTYSYTYKSTFARSLDYISFENYKFKPLADVYGRNTGKEIYSGDNKVAAEYISYRKVGDHATNMPSTVFYANGTSIKDNVKYKYDKIGNISEIYENGALKSRYAYDSLNRLIREDNKVLGETYLYDYDNNGNILNKRVTIFTLSSSIEQKEFETNSYGYDGDRLISYGGQVCDYNNLGNPTIYRDKAVEWQYGKRLTKLGDTTFAYDGLGRRVGKNDIRFVYDNQGRLIKQNNGLEFIYDNSGVVGVKFNGTQYFYRKDAQGNIIAIFDGNGNPVVHYEYDAWGNHAVLDSDGNDITDENNIGLLNPYRYRGYYYDTETGLYFLQTRYYDPELGRFISQDSLKYADPETINGLNLYSYCGNNPVMGYDPDGTWNWGIFATIAMGILCVASIVAGVVLSATGAGAALGTILLAAGIGGLIGMAGSMVSQGMSNGWSNINWGQVAFNGVTGAAIGTLMVTPIGPFAAGLAIGAVSFVESIGNDLFDYNGDWTQVNWSKAVLYGIASGVISGIAKSYVNYDMELMELGVKESFVAAAKPISSILRAVLKICFNLVDKNYRRRQT